MRISIALILAGVTLASPAHGQERWHPIDTIDLDPIVGSTPAGSGMGYIPWRDTLVLTLDNTSGQFAEITTDGALVGFFDWSPPPGVNLDNGGLAVDASTERLYYVNGLAATTAETVETFDVDGTDTTVTPSDVQEAGALARNPDTGELYVYDLIGRRLRRMSFNGSSYVTTSNATLPAAIFGLGDGGLAWNPLTGRLVGAGETAPDNGIIYDIDLDGTVGDVIVDTGITAGISALDFDAAADRLFVRTHIAGRRIEVYKRSPLFDDLGNGLAGTNGVPQLLVASSLEDDCPIEVELTGARANAPAAIIIGFSQITAPFKGGVLVPAVDVLLSPIPTDALGEYSILTTWPGAPNGLDVFIQFWIPDAAGPKGFAASNAVTATVP